MTRVRKFLLRLEGLFEVLADNAATADDAAQLLDDAFFVLAIASSRFIHKEASLSVLLVAMCGLSECRPSSASMGGVAAHEVTTGPYRPASFSGNRHKKL